MNESIFNNTNSLITLHTPHYNTDQPAHKTQAKKTIHTHAVQQHLMTIPDSNIPYRSPQEMYKTETELLRQTQRLIAQLLTKISPFLLSYLHRIDPITHPSPTCPLFTFLTALTFQQLWTRLLFGLTRHWQWLSSIYGRWFLWDKVKLCSRG